jgi:hypothetical protein
MRGKVRVRLLIPFWGHRPGTVGYVRDGRLYLKGSPPATVRPGDWGYLLRRA